MGASAGKTSTTCASIARLSAPIKLKLRPQRAHKSRPQCDWDAVLATASLAGAARLNAKLKHKSCAPLWLLQCSEPEGEAEREGGVIEWGQAEHTTPHTDTHIQAHSTQRWPLNCTASTRKMIVPIERKIAQQAQAQEPQLNVENGCRMAHQGSGQSKVIKWRIIYDGRSTCPDRRWPSNSYGGTSIVITKAKAHFASLPRPPLSLYPV